MDSDRFKVTHDSRDIKRNSTQFTDRTITGYDRDLGPVRIMIHIDTIPYQGRATLELWTSHGWVDACYRHGEELVDNPKGTYPKARPTLDVANELYDEFVALFATQEEN